MAPIKSTPAKSSGDKVFGLDTLRVFALVLITWQHAASVLGAENETQWRSISLGQTGVGIFCTISGFLAFNYPRRINNKWLFSRLIRIFPSYWIVTIISFFLVIVFGSNKPVSIFLFISQMFGLGYFTHGWILVNVVSWFISLILLCYVFSFIAEKTGNPELFWLFIAFAAMLSTTIRFEVSLSRHVLAFALGSLYAMQDKKNIFFYISIVLISAGVGFDPQLFYSGLSLLLLHLAVCGLIFEQNVFGRFSEYSYEYFLVHGIFLVGVVRFIENPFISIPLAIGSAMVFAIALKAIEIKIRGYIVRPE